MILMVAWSFTSRFEEIGGRPTSNLSLDLGPQELHFGQPPAYPGSRQSRQSPRL